ncbi:disease resistance protein Roq1 isoform X2 [Vigna angularis]|uniref:disease resistance protein Roq1 isoform X2 n=1 Tax=Phaseolus angularis TaxID=3914 RepID=UPI0022B33266|nr:disease resistance protein Roq1 isoform X2 [Vigna angularis]
MSEGMTVSDPTAPIGPSVVSDAIIHHTPSSSHSYDVFVSFRGEDTRNNFTSFLFGDLHRAGIVAFRDDECIKKGDFIAPELLQAIQGSRLFVVVLSKNYASSTWCLRELVEIFNCCETSPRPVIPIFYDVEPTTVRNQKGCYEKAFAEHENRFREDKVKMEEVQRWKEALRKLANISGSDIGNKDFYDGMTIKMHSLLVDLGRCIVREVSPKEPIKWSRLWTRKDLHDAMSENEATRNLEAIVLEDDQERDDVEIPDETIKADGLSKIKHLKLLSVRYVNFSGSLSHLSNELGYLVWYEYPFECLPQSFQPHKLVELSLNGRSIQRLWEGTKPLPNLKRLDLAFCESLVEMPDVAEALNLEWINLEGCVKLQKLNPSIGSLRKLVLLNLRHCKKLVILSNTILGLSSIKYLDVCGCSIIDSICLLDETRNTEPSSPLSYLCELDLSFCNLVEIPDYIGKLRCLESLNLEGNNFVKLPNLKDLLRLYYLNLQDCKLLKYLPDLPSRTVLPLEPSTLSRFSSSILGWPDLLFSSNRTGLIIIGCPELVEIEQCTTKSFSWAIQILEATYHHGTDKCLFPESIIPGSQIPSLFNNEFVNVDIEYLDKENVTVDPPPVPHDNNFIGVLCCVIFRLDHKQNPMNFRRDHMWLHYENVSIHIHPYPPFLLRSIISLLGYKGFVTVDVKKVQYRWVNEQDLINLKMTHCANLTARKRKISVIEENG